jgi:hypothetical protein
VKKHNDEAALVAEVERQLQADHPGYAWIRVGKGETFHRTTVRRAITAGVVSMLSYGDPGDGYGFQLRREF